MSFVARVAGAVTRWLRRKPDKIENDPEVSDILGALPLHPQRRNLCRLAFEAGVSHLYDTDWRDKMASGSRLWWRELAVLMPQERTAVQNRVMVFAKHKAHEAGQPQKNQASS